MPFINRNKRLLFDDEMKYLYKWLCRKGTNALYKLRNAPELVLNEYKGDLLVNDKHFPRNDDVTRLNIIKQHIEYLIEILPRYRKFLKQLGMSSYDVGMIYGFSSSVSWHNSYKKPQYIRAIITLINKHEEMLTRLNNPNG